MPANHTQAWLTCNALTVASLTELAAFLSVSRPALVRRVHELTGRPCIYMTFVRGTEYWTPGSDIYGRTPHGPPDRRPQVSQQANSVLEKLASSDVRQIGLLLRFGTRAFWCTGTAFVGGRQVTKQYSRRVESLVTAIERSPENDLRPPSRPVL
jgi:hypothetical protein